MHCVFNSSQFPLLATNLRKALPPVPETMPIAKTLRSVRLGIAGIVLPVSICTALYLHELYPDRMEVVLVADVILCNGGFLLGFKYILLKSVFQRAQ
jgi:hypothetical protein